VEIATPKEPNFYASGLIVAPVFIDLHVHLREPGLGVFETIETGRGCGCGAGRIHGAVLLHAEHQAGVTTFVCDSIIVYRRKWAAVVVFGDWPRRSLGSRAKRLRNRGDDKKRESWRSPMMKTRSLPANSGAAGDVLRAVAELRLIEHS